MERAERQHAVRVGAVHGPVPARGLRVLVVDDHVETAEGLAALLELDGYETRTAHDGLAALQLAREFHPDLVLLDIRLPGADGFQVAQRIRRDASIGKPVLVAMSGCGREVIEPHAYRSGIEYYLIKPIDPDKLTELFDSLGDEARARAARAERVAR